jgi:hypothetical protein
MKVFCCCRYTAEDGDQDYAEADYAEAAIQAADTTCSLELTSNIQV